MTEPGVLREDLEGGGQGVGYLVFHIPGTYPGPVHGNYHLVLGNIWKSVHRQCFKGPEAGAAYRRRKCEDRDPVLKKETGEFFHGATGCS